MDLIARIYRSLGYDKSRLIYAVAKLNVGKDIAPRYDEYGCAEAFNNLLKQATGKPAVEEQGKYYSTYWLQLTLQNSPRFVELSKPKKGAVVISATGFGGTREIPNGHVGVVGEPVREGNDVFVIYSNDSSSGKWLPNFTTETWKQRYVIKGRYRMRFYQVAY